jgi:hypothetical protein
MTPAPDSLLRPHSSRAVADLKPLKSADTRARLNKDELSKLKAKRRQRVVTGSRAQESHRDRARDPWSPRPTKITATSEIAGIFRHPALGTSKNWGNLHVLRILETSK